MFNYELFEQMIENRLFLEHMDNSLLRKSFSTLQSEKQRRLYDNVYRFLYPVRNEKDSNLHK